MSKIALFDLDGTLADYDEWLRLHLKEMASPDEPPLPEILHDVPEWLENRMRAIKRIPGWWREMPTIPANVMLLRTAQSIGFTCHVLTKGPSPRYDFSPRGQRQMALDHMLGLKDATSWAEKREWCHEKLKDVMCTVTEDKGLVFGRVLVDDYPEYIMKWLEHRPRGLVIMPASSSNQDFSHSQVFRYSGVDDLEQATDLLQEAYDRPDGSDEIVNALFELYEQCCESDAYPTSDEDPLYEARRVLQRVGLVPIDEDDE